jgi:hypothetical protein
MNIFTAEDAKIAKGAPIISSLCGLHFLPRLLVRLAFALQADSENSQPFFPLALCGESVLS